MTDHGLMNSPCVNARWGKHTDIPLPKSWNEFCSANPAEALRIETNDKDLVALLSGKASGTLRAEALSNQLSPCPPDPAEASAAARSALAQRLFDKGRKENLTMTEMMQLVSVNPEAAQLLQEQYKKEAHTGPEADRLQIESEDRARSKNLFYRG